MRRKARFVPALPALSAGFAFLLVAQLPSRVALQNSRIPRTADAVNKTGPFRKRICAPADDTTELFVNRSTYSQLT